MSETQEQRHFTISKVAADWHELMIPQSIMGPTGPAVQLADIPSPQSATLGFHPVAHSRKLLLIFHSAEDRKLSWLHLKSVLSRLH